MSVCPSVCLYLSVYLPLSISLSLSLYLVFCNIFPHLPIILGLKKQKDSFKSSISTLKSHCFYHSILMWITVTSKLFLEHHAVDVFYNSSNFGCSSVRPSVCSFSISNLASTSPPKPLNGLSWNFQGMLQTPSCASSHYFSMSVHLSVNK